MSSTIEHTNEGYVEIPLRLPNEVWEKIALLANASGLTIKQMTQAIFTLQMNAVGWLQKEKSEKKERKEKRP